MGKVISTLIAVTMLSLPALAQEGIPPARPEWIVATGFSLIEAQGEFEGPVAMAFPKKANQGRPGDIKYLVTELRGRIVAITNDGKKLLIKEVDEIARPSDGELPESDGEVGLNGMCLSADEKYLFTTGVIQSGFTIHNSVSRWEQESEGDWSRIKRTAYLKDIFLGDKTTKSHNIGHCLATSKNELIFGTGEGSSWEDTHLRDSTHGKIFRLDFNLAGLSDNPFFDPQKPSDPSSMFYASGFRNPWAITCYEGAIFVADNGPKIDRLVQVDKGRDYPWTGSDISMTYDNMVTFSPSIGPSGIVFVPWDHRIASLRGHLLITASHRQELLAVPLTPDFKIAGDWKTLVSPTDPKKRTSLAGIFLDGDDIYITHIRVRQNPDMGIIPSAILKLVPSDTVHGPIKLTGEALMGAKNCRACHVFAGRGGVQGPNLDEVVPRLRQQLSDEKFLAQLGKLQTYKEEQDHEKWVSLRAELIDQKGSIDQRISKYIAAKIEHPRFSGPTNQMPALGLKNDEIKEMTRYLMATERAIDDGIPWYNKLLRRITAKPAPAGIVILLIGLASGFLLGRRRNLAHGKR